MPAAPSPTPSTPAAATTEPCQTRFTFSASPSEDAVEVGVAEGAGGVERRKVGVGLSDAWRVEITDGLSEGEEVLTEKPPVDSGVRLSS